MSIIILIFVYSLILKTKPMSKTVKTPTPEILHFSPEYVDLFMQAVENASKITLKDVMKQQERFRKDRQLRNKKITALGMVVFTIFMIGFCLLVIFFGVID